MIGRTRFRTKRAKETKARAQRPAAPEDLGADQEQGSWRRLNLIARWSMVGLLDEAILEALKTHLPDVSDGTAALIRAEAGQKFMSRVRRQARSIRGVGKQGFLDELTRSKDSVVRQRNEAQRELVDLKRKVSDFRQQLALEEEALTRELDRYTETHGQELHDRIKSLFANAGAGPAGLAELMGQVLAVAGRSNKQGFEEVIARTREKHERAIDIYERRIAKLNELIELRDRQLKRLAKLKAIDSGIASIYSEVQGLCDTDELLAAKKRMLVDIFEANLTLQMA